MPFKHSVMDQFQYQECQLKEELPKPSKPLSLIHQLQSVFTFHHQEISFQRKKIRKKMRRKMKKMTTRNLLHNPKNINITKRESITTKNIDVTILILQVILIHQVSLIKKSIIIINITRRKIRRKLRNKQLQLLQSKNKLIPYRLQLPQLLLPQQKLSRLFIKQLNPNHLPLKRKMKSRLLHQKLIP